VRIEPTGGPDEDDEPTDGGAVLDARRAGDASHTGN
jgi:hypothetical protein